MTNGVWIRGGEIIETIDTSQAPVGDNALDAYILGWVSVTFSAQPIVEGTERAIRANGPFIAGVIQDEYGVVMPMQRPGFGTRTRPTVIIIAHDDKGRPRGWMYGTLEDVLVGATPSRAAPQLSRPAGSVYVRRHVRRRT